MKSIEPNFSLHTPFGLLTPEYGIQLLRWIEYNARISHRSEGAQTPDSWGRFLKAVVVDHADWSVTEHASVTAILRVDRGIMFEIRTHRLASYTAESTRFCNYQKKNGELEFIRPINLPKEVECYWNDSLSLAEENYLYMVSDGTRPQEARSILPNALASTISMTSNLRNWRSFFMSRVTREAHPDMRRITIPMLAEFKRCIPILYDDIEPEEKQSISLAKAR